VYVVCTVGEFDWNEGGVVHMVQLPAPYITLCEFFNNVETRLIATFVTMITHILGGEPVPYLYR
jgi:hypothetical protein